MCLCGCVEWLKWKHIYVCSSIYLCIIGCIRKFLYKYQCMYVCICVYTLIPIYIYIYNICYKYDIRILFPNVWRERRTRDLIVQLCTSYIKQADTKKSIHERYCVAQKCTIQHYYLLFILFAFFVTFFSFFFFGKILDNFYDVYAKVFPWVARYLLFFLSFSNREMLLYFSTFVGGR